MNKNKLLPGTEPPDKVKEAIAQLHENLPLMLEHVSIMARVHRHKYLSLLDTGFTEAQALELCKVIM